MTRLLIDDREYSGIPYTRENLGLVERGGPGSGHHGHRGRPGKVGGSLPSKGVLSGYTYEYEIRGDETYTKHKTDSLEEAVRIGSQNPLGRLEARSPDGGLWFSMAFPGTEGTGGYTLDEIDIEREAEVVVEVFEHFMEVFSDPENLAWLEAMDLGGANIIKSVERYLRFREEGQFADDSDNLLARRQWAAGMNIVMTNRDDNVGAGSSGVNSYSAKVFWNPVTLDPEKSVLSGDRGFRFGVDPIYVLMHELHHAFGSGSELDDLSDALAADYYLNNREFLERDDLDKGMEQRLAMIANAGTRRAQGDFKEGILRARAATGWLYSRHPDYFQQKLEERRAYANDETDEYSYFSPWHGDLDKWEGQMKRWAQGV